MIITVDQLKALMPKTAAKGRAERFIQPLNDAMAWGEINTPKRIRAFLATIAWESSELTKMSEDLVYRDPDRIDKMFKQITAKTAPLCVNNPEVLANYAYCNQYGNGSFESGDGYKFRARGPIGITFQDNYNRCGKALGLPLVQDPDLLLIPENGCKAAAWFWKVNKLNALADKGDFEKLTEKVNAAKDGMVFRLAYLEKSKRIIPDV